MATVDQIELIRQAGVIGAGGAGFPTYKKIGASVSHVIANGAECEPLLQKDRELMLHEPETLLAGLEIMKSITGAARVTVAVKNKNRDVLEPMRSRAEQAGYELFVYDDVYPAGDEFVLVHAVTGRQIPPGGLPLHVDCVVDNVETIVNIARAVEGRPVTEKYVTITGAVADPHTTRVPVGTLWSECIDAAGGPTIDHPAVLISGVMMGGAATELDQPVSKTTAGLIVLPQDHYLVRRKLTPREAYTRIGHGQCDQCSMCTELCPRYILGYPIEPHRVMRTLLMSGEAKEIGSLWAQYCCECNVCSYVACPEGLDPRNICIDAKKLLREKGMGRSEAELQQLLRPPHPARLGRQIPIKTLYRRLDLVSYAHDARYVERKWMPRRVRIPLGTHIGQPARPVVTVGDSVQKEQLIGQVDADRLGCPVHASVDGQVTAVTEDYIEIASE